MEPPAAFQKALEDVVAARVPQKHGYMPNAGYPEVRARVAAQAASEQGVALDGEHVVMSCGASGAMNAVLKTILDPGDEVIASVPCFMEYASYVDNHGGTLVLAPSRPDFDLDVDAIEGRITPRTAAVIVNSPNNPTGRIYPEDDPAAPGRRCSLRRGQKSRAARSTSSPTSPTASSPTTARRCPASCACTRTPSWSPRTRRTCRCPASASALPR